MIVSTTKQDRQTTITSINDEKTVKVIVESKPGTVALTLRKYGVGRPSNQDIVTFATRTGGNIKDAEAHAADLLACQTYDAARALFAKKFKAQA